MRLKCDFEVMELNEEKIAIPVGENASVFHGVVKLNDTAALILNLLGKETSEEDVVKTLMSEFDISRETAEKDVRQFITSFTEKGLIAL